MPGALIKFWAFTLYTASLHRVVLVFIKHNLSLLRRAKMVMMMEKMRLMAISLATGKVVVSGAGVVLMIDVVDSMIEAVVDSEGVGVSMIGEGAVASMIGEGAEAGVAAEDLGATGEDVADEVASTEVVGVEAATVVDMVIGTHGVETGEGSTKEEDFKTEKVLREETTLKTRK